MATKKTAAKPAARTAPESKVRMGKADCCAFWSIGLRLWWSVAWRTFFWISLPVMVLQIVIATLKNPQVPASLLGVVMMMVYGLPGMVHDMVMTAEFWFFIAVTLYSLVGGIFVYGYLAGKKRFLGLKIDVTRE